MSLHEELSSLTLTCKVCTYLASLKAADASEWARELSLPVREIGNSAIVSALARRGLNVTEASVRRHRMHHVA